MMNAKIAGGRPPFNNFKLHEESQDEKKETNYFRDIFKKEQPHVTMEEIATKLQSKITIDDIKITHGFPAGPNKLFNLISPIELISMKRTPLDLSSFIKPAPPCDQIQFNFNLPPLNVNLQHLNVNLQNLNVSKPPSSYKTIKTRKG